MEEFSYNYYNMDHFQLDWKERVLVGMKANQDHYNQGLAPIKTKDKVMGILVLIVPIISIVIMLHWTTVFSIIAGLMVATFFWVWGTIFHIRQYKVNQSTTYVRQKRLENHIR